MKSTRSEMIKPAIAFALNATLRDSEIRTLIWERINFLKGIITVGRSKTAAGTGRTIPINSELREILEGYRAWYENKIGPAKPESHVFPYGKNRPWVTSRPVSSFKTAWENVRERAGVKARFHDLRYFFASVLIENGESAKYVQDQVGHASITATFDTYGHLMPQAKQQATKRLERSIFGKKANVRTLLEQHATNGNQETVN